MIRLILVDDHKIIRDGLRSILKEESSVQVIGEANNGQELKQLLESGIEMPDVILMDINMPEMDGFETVRWVRENKPQIRVLVLSMLENEKYVSRMLEAGASGYLLKSTGKDELLHAIMNVAGGNHYICTDISLRLLRRVGDPGSSDTVVAADGTLRRQCDLTKREMEVLRLISDGLTNAEIADKLFTSKRTIESHRQNLIEKTKTKNTASLIKYALVNGLID